MISHNPYFNRWFSAMAMEIFVNEGIIEVTILILIDGFLQLDFSASKDELEKRHNPYFNRWFSAMSVMGLIMSRIIRSQSLF